MTTSGAVDLPLQVFGSYCPELPPASLPAGLSPWCADVEFIRGGVKTRPGLVPQFGVATFGNPSINYLKTYITPTEVLRLLISDSGGNVWKEAPVNVLNLIGTVVPGAYGKSTTCFGREYMAFGDGLNGIDIPRQYDDTNFDRVSQVGPGAAPTAGNENVAYTIQAPGAGAFELAPSAIDPAGASESGNLVTLFITGPVPTVVPAGVSVLVAGVGVGGYNGTFTITGFFPAGALGPNPAIQYLAPTPGLAASGGGTVDFGWIGILTVLATGFVVGQKVTIAGVGVGGYNVTTTITDIAGNLFHAFIGVFGLGASGNGTVVAVGNISAGVHQLSVVFVTRQGYITAPAPPTSWTAGGTTRAVVSNIPTGPPNIVARILIFTAAGGANFFYTGPQSPIPSGNMVISDNTTTSVTVDFSDAVLLSGINADELFNLIELGECSGVIDYADRMFWWGERNKVNNFLNMTFDGGFGGSVTNFPLGWVMDAVNYAGGGIAATQVWGQAYNILGNGAGAIRGLMTQSAFHDFRGVPIILPNTAYSVRARIVRTGAIMTQGVLHVNMFSASAGINTAGLQVTFAQAQPVFTEFTAAILPATATIPADLVIRVFADGTPTLGSNFVIDNIEVFPTNQPFNLTTVRASFNVGGNVNLGPESFDGVTGLLQPQPFDGQAIRCMFKLREFLYIVKERSLYVTQDDGVNEPSNWSIHQVSDSVGTPSVNGVAGGEDWKVIANRNGLYMFNGGEPTKISQEVQSNQTDLPLLYFWDNVNWSIGQLLWTLVDTLNKRILIGLPFGESVKPNGIFYLDYRPMNTSEDIISSNPIHTSYAGKVINYEHSRKWAPWSIRSSSAAMVERFNGTAQVFIGSADFSGNIYALSETEFDDNINTVANPTRLAINGFYTPYGFPTHDDEQGLQLGSHKKDFTYLTAYVEGAGLLSVNFYQENIAATARPVTQWRLDVGTSRDHEQQLGGGVTAERGFFQFGTNAVGSWFKMQKLVPSLKPSVIPLRGVS
jgi:hypothetical protein